LSSAAESIKSVLAIGGSPGLLVLRLIFLTPFVGRCLSAFSTSEIMETILIGSQMISSD
jgi:hypothetical protein